MLAEGFRGCLPQHARWRNALDEVGHAGHPRDVSRGLHARECSDSTVQPSQYSGLVNGQGAGHKQHLVSDTVCQVLHVNWPRKRKHYHRLKFDSCGLALQQWILANLGAIAPQGPNEASHQDVIDGALVLVLDAFDEAHTHLREPRKVTLAIEAHEGVALRYGWVDTQLRVVLHERRRKHSLHESARCLATAACLTGTAASTSGDLPPLRWQ
mmetsp:Transcript_143837/g.358549  ORF Transcript_143837/g.358549 Transcript_143837/m.358549 type:complete len:212 (-) Transcript_143837:364-999(-)